MAKTNRERALQERRERKQQKKDEKKQAAADVRDATEGTAPTDAAADGGPAAE